MISTEFKQRIAAYSPEYNKSLAPFTTWNIGGAAEVLVHVETSEKLKDVLEIAAEFNVPYRILGRASNVLISDNGIAGLVIINRSRTVVIPEEIKAVKFNDNPVIAHRHAETGDKSFYSFSDLEFEDTGNAIPITFDSACELSLVIALTTKKRLSGVQWFAGIPGTIGGSLYNNIHGGTKHFSDYFVSARLLIPSTSKLLSTPGLLEQQGVTVINSTNNWLEIEADFTFFQFGYDESILRKHQEIVVLSVTLHFYQRDDNKASEVAREWLVRKKVQPKKSCGSVFQAISSEQREELGFPTSSAGYIIDKVLNWRGRRAGSVEIALNHANFIENVLPDAKAADVLFLIRAIRSEVKKQLGIMLEPEINFLGFEPEELSGVISTN